MSAAVDITISRDSASTSVRGWVAPAFTNGVGAEQPARVYLEDATPDMLRPGDALTASGVTYAVETVGWWPPDSIEGVLAAANLPDTCVIEYQTGSSFDPATNLVTETWAALWSGPCAAQIGIGVTTSVPVDNAADQQVVLRGLVEIPASVAGVEPGYRVTLTASRDPRLVGSHLAVTAVQMTTTPALRVLNVSDVR